MCYAPLTHVQDLTLDNPITGKYWNTPNAIMTEKYAGAQDGNALVGSGVITGGWNFQLRFKEGSEVL